MFYDQRLKELEAEQDLLIAQSDLYRHRIQLQAVMVRDQIGWIGPVGRTLSHSNPWLLGGVALGAGFLVSRAKSGLFRWVPAALSVWRIARGIFGR